MEGVLLQQVVTVGLLVVWGGSEEGVLLYQVVTGWWVGWLIRGFSHKVEDLTALTWPAQKGFMPFRTKHACNTFYGCESVCLCTPTRTNVRA